MKNNLFLFFLMFVVVAQVASIHILVATGGVAIACAFWWGRRPRPKDRIVHRQHRSRIYDMP